MKREHLRRIAIFLLAALCLSVMAACDPVVIDSVVTTSPDTDVLETVTSNETEETLWENGETGTGETVHLHTAVIDSAVAPTCTKDGLTEGSHCSVCNDTIVPQTKVAATGHTWAAATYTSPKTCTVCKITEGNVLPPPVNTPCTHTTLNEKVIDTSHLGTCFDSITLLSCDCGQVQKFSENNEFYEQCEFVAIYDPYTAPPATGADEFNVKNILVCGKCNAIYTQNVNAKFGENCVMTASLLLSMEYNGEIIFDNIPETVTVSHPSQTTVSIASLEYYCFDIIAWACNYCNEILSDGTENYPEIHCDIDFDNPDKTETKTDLNGFVHTIKTYKCPDHGLQFIMDSYIKSTTECQELTAYYWTVLDKNGNAIFVQKETTEVTRDNHDYEVSYRLIKDSCKDGYIQTIECKKCGATQYRGSLAHAYIPKYLDLKPENSCGTIRYWGCNFCSEITQLDLYDFEGCCGYNIIESDPVIYQGENPNTTHCVMTYTCSQCGLVYKGDYMEEKTGTCTTVYSTEIFIYENAEADANDYVFYIKDGPQTSEDHDYKEVDFEMLGEHCEDGVVITYKCTRCNDTYQHTTDTCNHERKEFNIGCGIYADVCKYCGDMICVDYICEFTRCEESDDVIEDETGGDGTPPAEEPEVDLPEGEYQKMVCNQCGAMFYDSVKLVEVAPCTYKRDGYEIVIDSNGNKFERSFEHTRERSEIHDKYLSSYTPPNGSCKNGWSMTYSCRKCEWSETNHYDYHDTGIYREIYSDKLSNENICYDHWNNINRCLCGETTDIGYEYYDVKTYTCENCTFKAVTTAGEMQTGGIGDHYRILHTVFFVGDKELFSIDWKEPLDCQFIENVSLSFINEKDCTEGWTKAVTYTCQLCDNSFSDEPYSSNEHYNYSKEIMYLDSSKQCELGWYEKASCYQCGYEWESDVYYSHIEYNFEPVCINDSGDIHHGCGNHACGTRYCHCWEKMYISTDEVNSYDIEEDYSYECPDGCGYRYYVDVNISEPDNSGKAEKTVNITVYFNDEEITTLSATHDYYFEE